MQPLDEENDALATIWDKICDEVLTRLFKYHNGEAKGKSKKDITNGLINKGVAPRKNLAAPRLVERKSICLKALVIF